MKNAYAKPIMFDDERAAGFIPAILGVGMAATSALGMAASSAAAVGGLAVGAAAGAAAGGAAALAKKAGSEFSNREYLPTLDAVEVYS